MDKVNTEKHPLQQLLEDCDIRVRSYSGRGMYGKDCLGVDIKRRGLGSLMAAIVRETRDEDEQDIIAAALEGMESDSMGLGMIYYFPDVPYVGDDEDEDDA